MAYTYELTTDERGNIVVNIYKDGEPLIFQHVNPETGEPFSSEDEAKLFAEKVIQEYVLNDITSNPPHLKVQFLDPETGEELKVTKVGSPIKVNVELYYPTDNPDEPIIYAPVTGDYIIPYFNDDIPAGSTIIHIENGKGSGIITINKSGIYQIKLDKVLNAQTMKQPEPLPILDNNPIIAIVEELQEDSEDVSSTTDTTTT